VVVLPVLSFTIKLFVAWVLINVITQTPVREELLVHLAVEHLVTVRVMSWPIVLGVMKQSGQIWLLHAVLLERS